MTIWRDIRTAFSLATRVNALAARLEELELEWIDKKDAFERLFKRLATRDARWVNDGGDPAGSGAGNPATQLQSSTVDKNELRRVARERGLIR